MNFSSSVFLFIFLPLLLCFYYISRKKYRNYIILIASIVFYAWGETKYFYAIILVIIINYFFALMIDRFRGSAKLLLVVNLILTLGILFVFKYISPSIRILNRLFNLNIPYRRISFPLGISFFTLQAISYSVDVYRKKVDVQKNIIDLSMYIALFPLMLSGPIVRYSTIEHQLRERNETFDSFSAGVKRFITGLSKKVILAESCAVLTGMIFNGGDYRSISVLSAWLGAVSYSFQLYFDFSGYSDMAIGLGKMFGFDLPENFNYPYLSTSIREYWNRWHITLGAWFREYVYYPLVTSKLNTSINRCFRKAFRAKISRKLSIVFPLVVTWFLTGLWHEASRNYLLWSLYFSIIIILENIGFGTLLNKAPKILQLVYTFLFISISRVIVKTGNISQFFAYLCSMFCISGNSLFDSFSIDCFLQYSRLLIVCALFCFPIVPTMWKRVKPCKLSSFIEVSAYSILFIVSLSYVATSSYSPFIYFKY